jgi:response regulator RpfG family c-di-GMP phosphodiesterase
MAIAKLKQGNFDLVLMDINLPGKSGIDTTKEIRALGGRFKEVPIIALTANVTEDHMKRCRQVGMVDYVLKPFTSEEVYQAIARHRPARTGKSVQQPAAAYAPAEKPAPGKEGDGAALNHKLLNIREEFGPEYMAQMIEMCSKEIEGLIIKAQSAYEEKNYDLLGNCAHDIKSVSGSIGLRDVQDLAHKIETLCNDRQYESLPQNVPSLVTTARREIDRLSTLSAQAS